MKNRTNIDFSKHEVTVIKHDGVLIHKFARPNTINKSITFINTCGVCTVTGDFGNWVFCREFHPSKGGSVSDSYWDEKLEIASESQKSHEYCPDETRRLIKEFREEFKDSYGREPNEEEKEWFEDLEQDVDNKFEYEYVAYRNNPSTVEDEWIPYGKARHVWLNAVYDGFDALCEKLKTLEDENT